jgi:hypothetical protein
MPESVLIHVRPNETRAIRIFSMEMTAQQAEFQKDPIAMQQVLGIQDIDPKYVEIFALSDLDQLGLAGYLIEGCGVPESALAPERERLDALTGYVMLLHSQAFGGRAVTLKPTLPLIATFNEPATDWSGGPMPTQSAQLYTSIRPSPRQRREDARRSGAIVFTVFMLIIAAIVLMVVL